MIRGYDLFMAPLGALGLTAARRAVVKGATGRVLEIGAGTGLALPLYEAPPLAATDVDLPSLLRAKQRAPHVPLVVADAAALPFRNGAFDTVVETLVLCTVPSPEAALSEVKRVLAPGGGLRMLEHVHPPGPLLGFLAERLAPTWARLAEGCRLDRRTAECVERAGFAIEQRVRRARGVVERIVARRPLLEEAPLPSRSGG